MKLALRFSRPFFYAVILFLLISIVGIVRAESSISIVDPDSYVVRPGDRFHIDFWDGSTSAINVTVTPEGLLLLPSIGALNVGNLTLTEAKAKLNKLIGRFYSEADFTVSLVGVRPAKVMIIGGVEKPGLYDGNAFDRVSEMIARAGGFVDGASRREIKLYGYGREHNVDLLRFERTGDLKANPNIYAGDKILVPLVKDSSWFIHVSGEVVSPGSFEYMNGDNLGSAINLAMGLTGLEGDSVYICPHIRSILPATVPISDLTYPIGPGDKIIVSRREDRPTADYYSIVGEINIPGRYPYHRDLNLKQAVQDAGGMTERAEIFSLAIFRKVKYLRPPINFDQSAIDNPNNLALDGSLEPVSLNIGRSFDKHLDKIAIQPGDSIIIPAKTGLAGVFGMVNRPGTVALNGFAKASELISRAGGFARGADKGVITVIRKSSGMKINSSPSIDIFDGDTIIIERDVNRKSLLEKIRDISLIVGGASLVYLAVDNMTD